MNSVDPIEQLAADIAGECDVLAECIVMDARAWSRVIRGAIRGSSAYRVLLLSLRADLAARAAALFDGRDAIHRARDVSTASPP